jgi:hypothetical protein
MVGRKKTTYLLPQLPSGMKIAQHIEGVCDGMPYAFAKTVAGDNKLQAPPDLKIRPNNFQMTISKSQIRSSANCFEFRISVIGIYLSPPWRDLIGVDHHSQRTFSESKSIL